jgi:hypothetical protein
MIEHLMQNCFSVYLVMFRMFDYELITYSNGFRISQLSLNIELLHMDFSKLH